MTPERFRQVRNLFEATLERDADARSAFLAEACRGDATLRAEVGRLLAAHGEPDALLDRSPLLPTDPGGGHERMEGRRIDHYEILRELGCGGMGSVYLAARTDDVYRKPVAFKVVRPEARSEAVLQRFRQEREIVAELDHPNIARLLDGGVTPDGLPYFVMDYVDGQPIDAYCDAHQLNLSERLKLFRSVCGAVAYAHRYGVVHRDLKPGNIFVTPDGTVKLLDFGIAKLLRSAPEPTVAETTAGLRLMTPEYASPEQVRGDRLGPSSDIYSLGVVLYELLSGHRPYRMRGRLIHEVVRVICEEDPTPPSTAVTQIEQRAVAGDEGPVTVTPQLVSRARAATPAGLRRELSGDPDKIVMKALRKEPRERYRDVDAFSDDVRRHLEGLPVLARGQGIVYRAGKTLKQYRAWTIAAAALLAGVATGAVRISAAGVAVSMMFVATLVFGYRLGRSEFGRELATRHVFTHAWRLAVLIGVVLSVDKLTGDPGRVVSGFIGAMGFVMAVTIARWPFRERWAGQLLLDISRPKPTAARVWAGIMTVALGVYATALVAEVLLSGHIELYRVLYVVGMGLFGILMYFLWGRAEIHERGIVHMGHLIRWSRIESYAWEPLDSSADAPDGFVALRLQHRRLMPFPPTQPIVLPEDRRDQTQTILDRHLSQWP